MKITGIALVLAAGITTAVLAQDKAGTDLSCADYMSMDSTKMLTAWERKRGDPMSVEGTDDAPEEMMARAMEACTANPDGTVGEAMKMMEGDS